MRKGIAKSLFRIPVLPSPNSLPVHSSLFCTSFTFSRRSTTHRSFFFFSQKKRRSQTYALPLVFFVLVLRFFIKQILLIVRLADLPGNLAPLSFLFVASSLENGGSTTKSRCTFFVSDTLSLVPLLAPPKKRTSPNCPLPTPTNKILFFYLGHIIKPLQQEEVQFVAFYTSRRLTH